MLYRPAWNHGKGCQGCRRSCYSYASLAKNTSNSLWRTSSRQTMTSNTKPSPYPPVSFLQSFQNIEYRSFVCRHQIITEIPKADTQPLFQFPETNFRSTSVTSSKRRGIGSIHSIVAPFVHTLSDLSSRFRVLFTYLTRLPRDPQVTRAAFNLRRRWKL